MDKIVRHVHKIGLARVYPLDHFQCLIKTKMSGVRTFPQHPQNQRSGSFQERPSWIGNLAAISQVRQISEAKPKNGKVPMKNRQRLEFHRPHPETVSDPVDLDPENSTPFLNIFLEEVPVDDPKGALNFLGGVEVNREACNELNRPEFIQSEEVIDMGVGVNDIPNQGSALTQKLVPQIDSGVDENMVPLPTRKTRLEQRRGTSSLIPGIRRGASRALAPDNRNPAGCSGA